MNLTQAREALIKKIRREKRESQFKKIRYELVAALQGQINNSVANINALYEGQMQIIEAIEHNRNSEQLLDFRAINEYITAFQGNFEQDFKNEVVKIVFEKFKNDGFALASIAHLLDKCSQCQILTHLNIQQLIVSIIEQNSDFNANKLNNAKPVVYLLFNLLRHCEYKQNFKIICQYYPHLINNLGQFNTIVLLLLAEASSYNYLLPSRQIMLTYLHKQLPYGQISQLTMFKLYELIDNYIRYDLTSDLYIEYMQWIQKRLRERHFKITLKVQLIKLVIMILNSVEKGSKLCEELTRHTVIKQIIQYARFGNVMCKMASLDCLHSLVQCSSSSTLEHYIEHNMLLQILVYALQMNMDNDITFKILTAVGYSLQIKQLYLNKAIRFGLLLSLHRLKLNSHIKVAKLAQAIEQVFCQSKLQKI